MGNFMITYLFWMPFICFINVVAESRTNFKINRLEVRHVDPTAKAFINVTDEKDKQYCNYDVTIPIPADEHIGVVVNIDSILNNNTIIPLFILREKYLCKAANKYLGEFWYDILRAAQLIPGACPVPAGRYYGHHVYLNFRKISLQTFPFGRLRFIFKAYDDRRPKTVLIDILMDVENMPN